MRPAVQQHVENPSLGETVSDFDISICSFRRRRWHCSEVCSPVTVLCLFDSVLAGVFSCGPLFVTHVSLFTVFRDFGAEFGFFARR